MKRLLFLMNFLFCAITNMVAQKPTTTNSGDSSVLSYATSLSSLMKMSVEKKPIPFPLEPIADSLYNKLYLHPTDASLNSKYFAKTALQAFLAWSNDPRADYAEMEKCIVVTYKHKPFRNLNLLMCATFYAIWADEQAEQNKDKEQTYRKKAIGASERAVTIADELFPKDSITTWKQNSLIIAVSNCIATRDWRRAAKYEKEMLRLEEKHNGNDTKTYYENLDGLSLSYKLIGNLVEADSCQAIMQNYLKRHKQTKTEDYAMLLADRIDNQAKFQKYAECETLLLELNAITQPSDTWYLSSLQCGVEYYTETQNYTKALNYLQKAVAVLKGDRTITADKIYPWIVYGNIPNSGKEIDAIIDILQSNPQENDVVYLSTLSYAYSKVGRYTESAQVSRKAAAMYQSMTPEEQEAVLDYVDGMYVAQNDFDKRIELISKQIENAEKLMGKNAPLALSYKKTQASLYTIKGEYYKSEAILDSCLKADVTSMEELLDIYQEKADLYLGTGDYASAYSIARTIMKYVKDPVSRIMLYEDMIVTLISELDITSNDVTERTKNDKIDLRKKLSDHCEEMLTFARQTYGDGHINTIMALEMSATAAYFNADTTQMLQFADEAEKQVRQHVTNQELQKTHLEGLAIYYYFGGNYQKALSLMDQHCLNNESALFVEKTNTLQGLSEIYLRMGDFKKAQECYVRLSDILMAETAQQMNSLTAQGRQNYWRKYRQTLNNAGKFVDHTGEQNAFAGIVYNLALFSKSLLLNSDATFRRGVWATDDQTLKDKFTLMQHLNAQLTDETNINKEEYRKMKEQSVILEKELLSSTKGISESTQYQRAKWNDIQQALSTSDIAVELIEYITTDEKAHYGASIIRRDWTYPIFVEVGEKRKVEKQLNDLFYDDTAAKAAWTYLLPYLDGVKTINISLAGDFHKTPIENLSLDGEKTMAEKYTINRLTSTAELLRHAYTDGAGAVAFGGMRYKSLAELKGSDEEANAIISTINKVTGNAQSLTGDKATKESFQRLSSAKKEYIHVSTHGYYHGDMEDNALQSMTSLQRNTNKEDKALMRSGLYFNDDEKLTAYDISLLDLVGLDLVSLSACQTGLGDISADGVFGLQRGLKKAGAKSILMTLWQVANEPTEAFMTSFYSNLLSGRAKTKAEALEMAKQEIKKNPAWQSPDCWAGFVLLDGLK